MSRIHDDVASRVMGSTSTIGLPTETVSELVTRLADRDVYRRQQARLALEEIGPPAVEALVIALGHPLERVRWESAKALCTIAAPCSAAALVSAMEDHNVGIRWLAAEGLIAIGQAALRPLLEALVDRGNSLELREGAHHVLHDLLPQRSFPLVVPVLEALEHPAPELEVPLAASAVLDKIFAASRRRGRG